MLYTDKYEVRSALIPRFNMVLLCRTLAFMSRRSQGNPYEVPRIPDGLRRPPSHHLPAECACILPWKKACTQEPSVRRKGLGHWSAAATHHDPGR